MQSYEIIDNFLTEDEFQELKQWASEQKYGFNQNWIKPLLEVDGVSIIRPDISDEIHLFKNSRDARINKFQNKVLSVLNSRLPKEYKKIRFMEFKSHLYRYPHGSGILMHRDNAGSEDKGLRFGVTFYLNDEWDSNWGGELIIYKGGETEIAFPCSDCEPEVVVSPKRNRLAIVDAKWHKVSPNLHKSVDRLVLQTFAGIVKRTKPIIKK